MLYKVKLTDPETGETREATVDMSQEQMASLLEKNGNWEVLDEQEHEDEEPSA